LKLYTHKPTTLTTFTNILKKIVKYYKTKISTSYQQHLKERKPIWF